jgi:hypothetical protein
MNGKPTAQATESANRDTIWSGPRAVRDRRTPTCPPRVISVEPVTDAIRAVAPNLPATARYVAAISEAGTVVDVLSIPAFDLDGVSALRDHARQAALALGHAYYETGVWCEYCGRLCPPDVAFDHARWLRDNESRWVA